MIPWSSRSQAKVRLLPLDYLTPRPNAKPNTPNSKQREHKPAQNEACRASDRQLRSSTSRRSSTGRRRRRRNDHPRRGSSNLIPENLLCRTTDAHCRRIDVPDTRGDLTGSHRRSGHKRHSLRTSAECRAGFVAESHGVFESRYRSGPCVRRCVSVRMIVVDDAVAQDRIYGVPAVCLCGTAGGVGFVADDGDAGSASWEYCGA